MSRVHKVATVQFEPTMFEKARNIARMLELCEAAATAGARLIVTPEMGTTGYCWFDRAEVAPFVETVPGPTTERFAALARVHN
jgi:predicted amidohydrolase